MPSLIVSCIMLLSVQISNVYGQELLLYVSFDDTKKNLINNQEPIEKSVKFVEGKFGKGAYFDKGSYLRFLAEGNINYRQGTVEFWLKPNWNGDDGGYHYFFAGNITDARNVDSIHVSKKAYQGGALMGQIDGKGDENGIVIDEAVVPAGFDISATSVGHWKKGEWYHVAFSWNDKDKELKIYVDGLLRATNDRVANNAFPIKHESYINIGSSIDEKFFAEGVIDEFKIWSYPRTDVEVAKSAGLTEIKDYRQPPQVSKSNLQIYLLIISIFIILIIFVFKVIRTKGRFKHAK